ncbi:MAG: NAD-dependent epimerase/dehydratase family protein, partial [Pseudomonadota bacterium]
MTRRILITGSAGYLGSKAVDLLAARGGFEVYGIDIREPANRSSYKMFVKGSVADQRAMQAIFDRAKPSVAVHLAFVVTTTHDRRLEESVAIDGTRNFLEGCERAAVPKAVYLSSAAAYGAHEDNESPLTETSPVRGVDGYGYSRLKARSDGMACEFMAEHGACEFAILRPCLFVGPNTRNNFFDVLGYPIVPQIVDGKGVRDPLFQFIHEDDMAECLAAAIEK